MKLEDINILEFFALSNSMFKREKWEIYNKTEMIRKSMSTGSSFYENRNPEKNFWKKKFLNSKNSYRKFPNHIVLNIKVN